jgi:hypothetical protein
MKTEIVILLILDSQGEPLASANVIVRSPDLQGVRGTSTDVRGFFRFLALPAGVYTVEARLLSFRTVLLRSIRVRLGMSTTTDDIRLDPQSLEMGEIIISGDRPLIDPSSSDIGATLVTEEFRSLPLQRNYVSIPALMPQANESPFGEGVNFSGATGIENQYLINGSEVTEPYIGVRGLSLPYNFIKEVEIRTGGYAAEYRSTLGGIVNATTYSGGNNFSGQAFGFYTSNGMSANAYAPAESRTARGYASYDAGFGIGGPIVSDMLWFYMAYNPSFVREDVLIPGLSTYSLENQTLHGFAGKLTWKVSDNATIVGSVVGDPTTKRSASFTNFYLPNVSKVLNKEAVLQDWDMGTINGSVSSIVTMGDNVLLEGSISQMRWWQSAQPIAARAKSEVQFIDQETATVGGGIGMYWDQKITQTTAEAKATWIVDRHTFKSGVGFREKVMQDGFYANQLVRSGDTTYLKADWTSDAITRNRLPSVFFQDTWLVSDRLSLCGGLRWDGQFVIASDVRVHQKILGQFQPRVGFVLQLGEPGTERVYGSAGRFYEELGMNFVSYYSDRNIQRYINFNHDPRVDPTGGKVAYLNSSIPDEVPGLKGQYNDEFVLGYERRVLGMFKAGVRGIYRVLGQAVEDVYVQDLQSFRWGNPGEGILSFAPRPERQYTALVLTFERPISNGYSFSLSYVLSRTYGNYPGLFNSDNEQFNPNATTTFDVAESFANSTGLLPNDVTHMLKFSGSYEFDSGLSAGATFLVQSGVPVNEFGGTSFGPGWATFLQPRGYAGRTPALWDLNVRLTYNIAALTSTSWRPRLILDILHLASQRKPTALNQMHYFTRDANGNQIDPNPFYLTPTHYQLPMSVRLGIELSF